MNILLLSNSAPNYFHFFNNLAQCFAQDGASVCVAVDSQFSRKENKLDTLGFSIYEFENFSKNHTTSQEILKKYRKYNLNYALLSDFERAESYKVWGKIDNAFYDHLKSALLSFYEEIWANHKIDQVIYENISNTFAYFALFVAQEHGSKYIGIGGSRLPGRFSITADPLNDTLVQDAFKRIQRENLKPDQHTQIEIQNYIKNIETITPDYMKFNGSGSHGIITRYLNLEKLKKIKSLVPYAFSKKNNAFQVGNPFITHYHLFLRNVKRRINIYSISKLYDQTADNEQFILYPLHFHPESSTSILAGVYLDEYEVIRNIAFSLPEGMRLYVKDHISAWGYPCKEFYKKIKRLPNVRLLAPTAPTKELIKKSSGVITLTSTVGYEALLLKKQVFLFGRVFYEFHDGVTKIDNLWALHDLISKKIEHPPIWDDKYNQDFVLAYRQSTYPGALNLSLRNGSAEGLARDVYTILKGCHYNSNLGSL